MKALSYFALSSIALLCVFSKGAYSESVINAEPQNSICFQCHVHLADLLLSNAQTLQNIFSQYRGIEERIRLITYGELWQARQDSLHPLSRKKRARGRRVEGELLEVLKSLDRESEIQANQFEKILRGFSFQDTKANLCCEGMQYRDCLLNEMKMILPAVEKLKTLWGHIREGEREYRKEVDLTAAGRSGLYPQDALEEEAKHADYYERFERTRFQNRFQETRSAIDLLLDLELKIRYRIRGSGCCRLCQVSRWDESHADVFSEN